MVIVGAGPAGLATAFTVAKRGHEVLVLEKEKYPGGQIRRAVWEPFKLGMQMYLKYLEKQIVKQRIPVRYSCETSLEMLIELRPDAVVIAAGARFKRLDIPGRNLVPHCTPGSPEMSLLPKNAPVVILGAGMTGCEIALAMDQQGYEVTLISRSGNLAKGCSEVNRIAVLDALKKRKVPILTWIDCREIIRKEEKDYLRYLDQEGKELELPCEGIVEATGTEPERGLIESAVKYFPEIYAVGDCVSPGKVADAVEQGFYTGLRL